MGEEWIAFQIMNDVIKRNNSELSASRTFKMPVTTEPTKKQAYKTYKYTKVEKTGSVIAALIMLLPILLFMWAAITSYDPGNSVSVFLTMLIVVGGLIFSGAIIHIVAKDMS